MARRYRDDINAVLRRRAERYLDARTLAMQDVTPVPGNPERWERCRNELRLFCEEYLANVFALPWSDDHLTVINVLADVIRNGGQYALAMPRGSGKTSLVIAAALWALLYAFRRFVVLIGADEQHAKNLLNSIKSQLAGNDVLTEDFKSVCGPIRAIGGVSQRVKGLMYDRSNPRSVQLEWLADRLVFPAIDGYEGAGNVVMVAGLTSGTIRGPQYTRYDGRVMRPDLVILDDPQTDESARSLSQVEERERILGSTVMHMGGPRRKIATVVCCTVIRAGDLADRLLDKKRHPEWRGSRMKMLYSFPSNSQLWERYADVYIECLRNERGLGDATRFYQDNRDAMQAGARVAWSARYNEDECDALQHAMNLYLRDERAFMAEYQNDPQLEEAEGVEPITRGELRERLNGYSRGVVPADATRLTAFIDVQLKMLYWIVVAWTERFDGYVIDYGTYPEQRRRYFTKADARATIQRASPGNSYEGALYDALEKTCERLLTYEWRQETGVTLEVERCLIDANWGQSRDTVYKFCRQGGYRKSVMPSHGRYIGASAVPITSYRRKTGERIGENWMVRMNENENVRYVLFDTNYWKTFVRERLRTATGDRGSLTFYGKREHGLLFDHLLAEYYVPVTVRNNVVYEWHWRPGRPDNDWFDCLVGAAVAASVGGCSIIERRGLRRGVIKRRKGKVEHLNI